MVLNSELKPDYERPTSGPGYRSLMHISRTRYGRKLHIAKVRRKNKAARAARRRNR